MVADVKALIEQCAQACRLSYNPLPDHHNVRDLRFSFKDNILAFRGTSNKMNVRRDINVMPKRTIGGHLAHKGFVDAANELVMEVYNKTGGLDRTKIVITGHSLGGAIALLFAELFNCRVITFGCPRVYCRFGSAPSIDHVRIICDDDPVPMIPNFMFRHLHAAKVLRDQDGGIDVEDHDIDVYIARLKNLIL